MELMTGTLIYFFISIGLIVGAINGFVIGREGVSLKANVFWGVVGAVIMGYIGVIFGIGDGVFFSFIATWPFLFLINVFHRHHVEEVLGETHDAEIVYDHHSDKKTPKPVS